VSLCVNPPRNTKRSTLALVLFAAPGVVSFRRDGLAALGWARGWGGDLLRTMAAEHGEVTFRVLASDEEGSRCADRAGRAAVRLPRLARTSRSPPSWSGPLVSPRRGGVTPRPGLEQLPGEAGAVGESGRVGEGRVSADRRYVGRAGVVRPGGQFLQELPDEINVGSRPPGPSQWGVPLTPAAQLRRNGPVIGSSIRLGGVLRQDTLIEHQAQPADAADAPVWVGA
jgi:hypothetical protein